jgi:hypothetical protein
VRVCVCVCVREREIVACEVWRRAVSMEGSNKSGYQSKPRPKSRHTHGNNRTLISIRIALYSKEGQGDFMAKVYTVVVTSRSMNCYLYSVSINNL